jgi:Brp/Blh family beta-carotene 15,15'-monooxygenase
MNSGLSRVFELAQRFSRAAVVLSILVFAVLRVLNFNLAIGAQITIALLALTLGIPHGAIDHLITLPATPRSRFALFIIGYITIAILAGFAIASWNLHGFQFVLLMSALHFGIGDAAYANEWRDSQGLARHPWFVEISYALPAGLLPVILPLTDSRSLSALNRINLSLGNWAGSHGSGIRQATLVLAAIGLLITLVGRATDFAIDLIVLVLLAEITPPLVTFAMYFGCWHAVRHTARLVPKLPRALKAATDNHTRQAYSAAIVPGLYAVVGTLALGGALMIWDPHSFGSGLFWSTLVIVWSLTVPHMMTTARFDWRAIHFSRS